MSSSVEQNFDNFSAVHGTPTTFQKTSSSDSVIDYLSGAYNGNGINGDELIRFHQIMSIVVPTLLSILFLAGVVANGFVIYVTVVTNRTSKHPIHSIFVLNLAAADIIFLIVAAPQSITQVSAPRWRFGSFLCPFFHFMGTTTVCASIYTICALAWIRFMALVMPFRFRRSCISTRKAGYFVVLAIWLAGIILSAPDLFYYGIRNDPKTPSCDWLGTTHAKNIYGIVKVTANYFFPLLLVTVFYAVVGREVLCYMMHRNSLLYGARSEEQKECFKSTIVVLSLILSFLLCWLPHCLHTIFTVVGYGAGPKNWKQIFFLRVIGLCTSYAHAFVNPFIYTFASPIFRRSLRDSVREKLRGCCDQNPLCTRREASITRGNNVDGQEDIHVAPGEHREGKAQQRISVKIGIADVATPKTERTQMLVLGDSHFVTHATEVTRIATPDLSDEQRSARSTSPLAALEASDVEENDTAKNRKVNNRRHALRR